MKIDSPNILAELQELHALPDEDEHEDYLLSGLDLAGEELRAREFRGCILRKVNLSEADLRRAGFVDVVFDHCDLSGCKMEDAGKYIKNLNLGTSTRIIYELNSISRKQVSSSQS